MRQHIKRHAATNPISFRYCVVRQNYQKNENVENINFVSRSVCSLCRSSNFFCCFFFRFIINLSFLSTLQLVSADDTSDDTRAKLIKGALLTEMNRKGVIKAKVFKTFVDSYGKGCFNAACMYVNLSNNPKKEQIQSDVQRLYDSLVKKYAFYQIPAITQNLPIEPIATNSANTMVSLCNQMLKLASTAFDN